MKAIIAMLAGTTLAFAGSKEIRNVDYANFEFPWVEPDAAPDHWHWLQVIPESRARLKDGSLQLEPQEKHDAYLLLTSVVYGDLDHDGRDEAVAAVRYGSGGTANWYYVYVWKSVKGKIAPVAMLESGSRAYGGLVEVRIDRGLFVLGFEDRDKRVGDCCSTGVIDVSYRLKDGSFIEVQRRRHDVPLVEMPTKHGKPQ